MRSLQYTACFLLLVILDSAADGQNGTRAAPDQRYGIAFASFAPLNTDIFIAAADGSDPKPLLPHPDLDYNASFSPDAQWIIFTSTRNGSADIYRVRPDGSGVAQLTNDAAFDDQGALSPDGRTLAFVSSRGGQADIWALEVATGALRNVTHHPAGDFRPSWSPDGQWLAFSSDRDSKKPMFTFATLHSAEIFVVRLDGSQLRRVTYRDAFSGSPAWSLDGKRLVYYEAEINEVQKIRSPLRVRGTSQIVSIDLKTNEKEVLSNGTGEKWSPHWLIDGRVGYASGGPDGGIEFTTGTTGARGEVRSPSWSPDGRRMVFHRDTESRWPPLRDWPSADPRFRLVRTGVFPSYAPGGDQLVLNDEKAGILHNSVLVMNATGRSVQFSSVIPNEVRSLLSGPLREIESPSGSAASSRRPKGPR